ncbi:Rossmann-fold superfamily protein [Perilla frutescens var. hirtella]|uniref:Rossmann-fold superfamily protein n=1 Tax=Perilla frutescens var. hirtella TaxID=608512 RepID=A0AAD4NZM5_PERFH|nr:Rossmann-fold superfamily protein [Perilla frutescens var. hirtella]
MEKHIKGEKCERLGRSVEGGGGFEGVRFKASECLEVAVRIGDVISCATNSEVALVKGAHLDLVGSFTPSMRECDDDEAVRRGTVFVDNETAAVEAGELVGAFERGVMRKDEIAGELVELIKREKVGRRSEEEITAFKSVGSAVVDLLSAQMVYEKYINLC